MTEQELYDGLKRICEAQEATMRQCRIMVAGFKATGEQDTFCTAPCLQAFTYVP